MYVDVFDDSDLGAFSERLETFFIQLKENAKSRNEMVVPLILHHGFANNKYYEVVIYDLIPQPSNLSPGARIPLN